MGKLTLILGGARSGKSSFAERLAHRQQGRVVYVATAQPFDEEMARRVAAHKYNRPENWQTLEIPLNVGKWILTNSLQADLVLLDCLTLLVSNQVLLDANDLDTIDEMIAAERVENEAEQLLQAIRTGKADWLIVSNEVGMGLVPPYPLGRVYRDLLGRANQRLAVAAERVYFMVAGIPMRLSPEVEPDLMLGGPNGG